MNVVATLSNGKRQQQPLVSILQIVIAVALFLCLLLVWTSISASTIHFPTNPAHTSIFEEDFLNQTISARRNTDSNPKQPTTKAEPKDGAVLLPETTNNNNNIIISDPSSPLFVGSTVKKISPGMLLYEDVCLVQNNTHYVDRYGTARVKKAMKLRAYTASGQGLLAPGLPPDFYERNYQFLLETEGGSLEEWYNESSKVLIEKETLFTIQLFRNPGHCLSDLVFSLAYDRRARSSPRASFSVPFYPRFVYGAWQEVRTQPYQPDWCFEFMRAAGLIGNPNNTMITTKADDDSESVCFRRLLVPILGLHRFPIKYDNPSDKLQKEFLDSFKRLVVMELFQTRDYTRGPYFYPSVALEDLRQYVGKSLGLSREPWPASTLDDNSEKQHVSIFMYTRKGSARRHWLNSEEVKIQLERDFYVSIQQMGQEWEELNMTQQLTLYNSLSHIITVHGAQEANLIVCRPNTKIIEIQCTRPTDSHPDFQLNRANDSDSGVAWYGPLSWYPAFTRRLHMEHFLYTEAHGCVKGNSNAGIHGATEIRVNVTQMVHFVASRFGLSKRDTS